MPWGHSGITVYNLQEGFRMYAGFRVQSLGWGFWLSCVKVLGCQAQGVTNDAEAFLNPKLLWFERLYYRPSMMMLDEGLDTTTLNDKPKPLNLKDSYSITLSRFVLLVTPEYRIYSGHGVGYTMKAGVQVGGLGFRGFGLWVWGLELRGYLKRTEPALCK